MKINEALLDEIADKFNTSIEEVKKANERNNFSLANDIKAFVHLLLKGESIDYAEDLLMGLIEEGTQGSLLKGSVQTFFLYEQGAIQLDSGKVVHWMT